MNETENKITKTAADKLALTMGSLTDIVSWPCWVLYLLERLDAFDKNSDPADFDDDATFEWVLREIRDAIEYRLDRGSW